jgi:hypothetical protein
VRARRDGLYLKEVLDNRVVARRVTNIYEMLIQVSG